MSASTARSNSVPPADVVELRYSIAGCSDYSPRYEPDNIKFWRPHDISSRWSSNESSMNSASWITLKLDSPSILESIEFGKFQAPHPCNVKDFEIQAGMSQGHMKSVLRSQLQNDSKSETFHTPSINANVTDNQRPVLFVKIVCISAHSANFNTSLWHVKLHGISDERYIRRLTKAYDKQREDLSMQFILKHLRQRRHISVYKQLLSHTDVELEHPLVTSLHESLVIRGDWSKSVDILGELASEGLFSNYIHSCTPLALWKRLRGTDANGDVPSRRGGHAMCMDVDGGLIYLFGGYDGQKSLDDFWVYTVREDRWRLISHSVSEEKNGPGPRACHKMVFDPKSGCIYMLGRLGDDDLPAPQETRSSTSGTSAEPGNNTNSAGTDTESTSGLPTPRAGRPNSGFLSEFYRFRTRGIDQGNWELLCVDTATANGPKLVYDHQLVLDSDAQMLYVHGGRVVDGDWAAPKFSGLYSYDLRTGKWAMLQSNLSPDRVIPSRFGHSMTYDHIKKQLFVFAGQKEEYLSDMWMYDVSNKQATQLFENITACGGPKPCFAQRAVIDPILKEIYVFCGQEKISKSVAGPTSNIYLYRYDNLPGSWTCVPSANHGSQFEESDNTVTVDAGFDVPVARCAHQIVYDSRSKVFYMHGGNGGGMRETPSSDVRLDDFWSMTLQRPSTEEVVRKATLEIRKQQFREMCQESAPIKALGFLQNDVSSVVDHDNDAESTDFQSLLVHLLAAPAPPPVAALSQISASEEDSRIPTPSSSGCSGEGAWTSGSAQASEDDAVMVDASIEAADDESDTFMGPSDSYELALRGDRVLSDERFQERTKVFEKLLAFVNPDSKQPEGNLVDVLDSA